MFLPGSAPLLRLERVIESVGVCLCVCLCVYLYHQCVVSSPKARLNLSDSINIP